MPSAARRAPVRARPTRCSCSPTATRRGVRDQEIEFVKQAQERCLGIRVLMDDGTGRATAITSTCDLSPEAVDRMAEETVALARATAPDGAAGLPESGFAEDLPDLGLADPGDRHASVEARIDDAKRAEPRPRAYDERIDNSEGSQAGSDWNRIVYGNTEGFVGEYESAYHLALLRAPRPRGRVDAAGLLDDGLAPARRARRPRRGRPHGRRARGASARGAAREDLRGAGDLRRPHGPRACSASSRAA